MPKCPVCKTECGTHDICPECKFTELSPLFLNKLDGINWEFDVVEPWRHKYWETLSDFQMKGNTLLRYFGKQKCVNVPYGISKIGTSCFSHNRCVQEIVLPKTLSTIESFAFAGCVELSKILLPSSLSVIEHHAFALTDALAYVVIPENISHIGTAAFMSRYTPERTVSVFFEASKDTVNPWGEYCHRWGDSWDANIILYTRGEWHYDEDGEPVPNANEEN